MNPVQKSVLTLHTVNHLRWTQILHRILFRLLHPKQDFSSAPPQNKKNNSIVAFPQIPDCYLGNDTFLFLNEKNIFSTWNDSCRNKLWLYNLHYFDWLRQANLPEEEGNRWIEKWIDENTASEGNGWEPYTLSLRIVNWIKWDIKGHKLTKKAKDSLAVQIRFLQKRLEYHLLANHLLANAKALVFSGMFFSGNEAKQWLNKGLEIYRQQLPEQILSDGGHFELSPMYHSIILEDLLDLKNILSPLDLDQYIARMTSWLSVMTGPDGKIALFNDSADGIALAPQVIIDYAESLGIRHDKLKSPILLSTSGYARLSQGNLTLIADCGEIGPSYQPGHAHADALSFEVWKDNKKVITNSGTCRYYDSPERKYQRSSIAHNTAVIDNTDSSEIWGAHRVARRGHIVQRELESSNTLSASFQTYGGIIHQRKWIISHDTKIVIEDHIYSKDKKNHQVSLFFHLLDDSINISTHHAMESQKQKTLFSPQFGILDTKETYIFSDTFKSEYFIQSEISF